MPFLGPSGIALLLGFIAGSLPTGYLAGRARGIDIRDHGSRNIGFTNVYRVIGPAWAVPVLVIDVLKGVLPVYLAARFGLVPPMAGLGAIIGHVFTPWLRFRGGKGVATTIGVFAAVSPLVGLAGIGCYALVLLTTGYISVSSIVFAAALAPLTTVLYPGDLPRLVLGGAVGILVILRHASNIGRLMRGEEPRFGLWLKLFRRKKGGDGK
ncbi:MAG: glycerol-3-phosphate 1-O-acyltransferase PlsY [bacterium]